MHEPTAAFELYKRSRPPRCSTIVLFILFSTLLRSALQSHHALSILATWFYAGCRLIGLATAENASGTTGLKPETSIDHSSFDPLVLCDRTRSLNPLILAEIRAMQGGAHALAALDVAPSQLMMRGFSEIVTVSALAVLSSSSLAN